MHRMACALILSVALVLATCASSQLVWAQEKPEQPQAASPPADALQQAKSPLTVAVLNFEAKDKPVGDLGEKIADLLTVFLGLEEHLQLVERARLQQILEEMELGASGVVAPGQATRIGGLLGAQVLVTGRAFVVNEKLYITGKAISVETSRLGAELAKGGLDQDLDVPVQELAAKLAAWLKDNADKMVASIQTPADQVAVLKTALGDKERPTVAAMVIETHVGQATIDPAAETEVIYLMRKVGIPAISGRELRIADWAMEFLRDASLSPPSISQKADVVIVGEGFSEYAGRKGNLISVKARVELKAVYTKTGRILAISRSGATHVDLAELIAGKTALQMAAGKAAVELLPEAVEEWNKIRAEEARQEKEAEQEKE